MPNLIKSLANKFLQPKDVGTEPGQFGEVGSSFNFNPGAS